MTTSTNNLESVNGFLHSGILAATKLQLSSISNQGVLGQFEVTQALLQPAGILNGGVSLLITETVTSIAANFVLGDALITKGGAVGIEVSGNHLEPVRAGIVKVRCSPAKLGSRIQLWQVQFFREDGKLSFVGQCTLLNVSRKPD